MDGRHLGPYIGIVAQYQVLVPGRPGSTPSVHSFSFNTLPMDHLMPAGQDRPAFDENKFP